MHLFQLITNRFLAIDLLLNFFCFIKCEFPFTVLHTNDVHARFVSFNSRQRPCEPVDLETNDCYGGIARRLTAYKKYKKQDPNVIWLDAGDQFQGTLWYTALKWHPIAAYMNIIKYDAMAFGNHEFDDGMTGLEPFLRNLTTPIISSNIEDRGSPVKELYKTTLVKEIGGQKIGIVGTITRETPDVSRPGPTVEFREEVRAIQPIVDKLIASGVNKIIVLSHSGIEVDRQICRKVKGVDIVVGGHSHTFLYSGQPPVNDFPEGPYPEVYDGPKREKCVVVQAYAYGKYLGRLRVTFDDQGILRNWSGNNPILLDAKSFEEDEEMVALLKPYGRQLEHFQQTIVAKTAVALDGTRRSCRAKECNLGNLVTDAAVYYYTKRKLENRKNLSDTSWSVASIGLWNGGGVRDYECRAGEDMTLGDLYVIMPFQNTICKIGLKGKYLKEAFEHSVADYNPKEYSGKFLQVSGIKVVYDLTKPNGQRVQRLRVRCHDCAVPQYEDVQMDKVYEIVTITYLSIGGDGFAVIKNNTLGNDQSNMLDIDIVLEYIRTYQPLIDDENLRIEYDDGTGKTSGQPFLPEQQSSNSAIWSWGSAVVKWLTILQGLWMITKSYFL